MVMTWATLATHALGRPESAWEMRTLPGAGASFQSGLRVTQTAVSSKTAPQPCYHLLVRDAYNRDFWLHLEMNGRSTLKDLDRYLRAIWLECCGHLSQFSVAAGAAPKSP